MTVAIGVDIGNVIIGGDTDNDAMFSDQYLTAPELPGAIETIAWLNLRSPFRGRVFLVSKCGENVQRKSREWLAGRKFIGCHWLRSTREQEPHACRVILGHQSSHPFE